MRSYFIPKTIFVILLGLIEWLPAPAQVGSVIKKVSKSTVQNTVKKTVKKEMKTYGCNSVEKATINQALKKEICERMEKQMKKDGIESFFEYGNKKVVSKIARTRLSSVRNRMNKSNYKAALKEKGDKNIYFKPASNSNLRKNIKIVLRKEGDDALEHLSRNNPDVYATIKEMMKEGGPLQDPYWNKFVCEIGEQGELIVYNLRTQARNTAIMIKGNVVTAYSGCSKDAVNQSPNLFLDYLLPDKKYIIDDGKYIYEVDKLKRTISGKAVYSNPQISYKTELDNVRRENVQRLKQGRGTNVDDAGHIFQHNRGGINETINLVPMDNAWQRNGLWRKLEMREENIIKLNLVKNKKVESTRHLFYEGNSSRPSKITVELFVDGKRVLSETISCP